jgi:aldehyde:ferredoxin oxidoreductase
MRLGVKPMTRYRSTQQRVLRVDLTHGSIDWQEVPSQDERNYLGGRGIAAALLARTLPADVDPLAPDAPLIFSMGTLTGTTAPMSGRSNITFVSPATGLYCKTNVGGHFGLYCKLSGVDYILITGRAREPVYLWIGPDDIAIRSAATLWGKGVRDTTRALQEVHGHEINVACIGPAGENRVLFAAVMSSVYNAAARGGGGAVMGAKGLKAITVSRPDLAVVPADPDRFRAAQAALQRALYEDSMADSYYTYGTAASVDLMNETETLPSYNFQRGSIESIEQLTSQYWNEKELLKGRIGCAACIYSCHRFLRIEEGPHRGAYSAGPEYETVSALGSGPGVDSIGAVHRSNELCNDLGLDTISAGGVIQWAMECEQRGVLPDKLRGDLDLSFGSTEAITRLPEMIARREGIGDLLAEGVARAARQLGGDSWKWAVHTRGLEQSRVETRGAMGYALAFAMNPRGPDHLHTECLAEFGMTPEMKGIIEQITGDVAFARPDIIDKRAEIVRWHEDIYAVSDSLGLCAFVSTAAYGASPERCAELFAALTGVEMDADSIMRAGRRILTLERMINLRLGWTNDPTQYAPWRLMNEKAVMRGVDNPILDQERMQTMVSEYYRLHGWHRATGIPTDDVIRDLGLEEFQWKSN